MTNTDANQGATGLRTAIVLIGRNEGERLRRCLASATRDGSRLVVYVDSNSTDDSVALAESFGALVVALDMRVPFSAARARNAGWRKALQQQCNLDAIHFFDGDCEIEAHWLPLAEEALERDANIAAVCGYRRERFPERSLYNRACDVEWRFAPAGEARAFGGDVLVRTKALLEVDGYRDDVIAAEDDELAIRIRQAGYRIVRLATESTKHDAAMQRFGQWWQRQTRAGHGFAQVEDLHGKAQQHFQKELRRTLLWGAAVPAIALGFAPLTFGSSLGLLGLYPLQAVRIARATKKRGFSAAESWAWGATCAISKVPETVGVLRYWSRRIRGVRATIIEYK